MSYIGAGITRFNTADDLTVTDDAEIQDNATVGGNLSVTGTTTLTDDLNVDSGTLFVDASEGRVGVGTTTPAGSLHIQTASSGATGDANTDDLTVEGSINTGINILCPNDRVGGIRFGDPEDEGAGKLLYFHNGDYMRFDTTGSEKMRLDSSGKLALADGIGTTSTAILEVRNNIGSEVATFARGSLVASPARSTIIFRDASNGNVLGSIRNTTSGTAYEVNSDYRLKENVVDMTGAINRVKALKPSQFNFIISPEVTVDGFLAHEVQEIVPEAVSGEKDAMQTEEYVVTPAVLDEDGNVVTEAVMGTREVPDYQGIDQAKLVPLLTGALQEAIAKIEALETTQASLIARIEALEAN
jgi:hypothetical protein